MKKNYFDKSYVDYWKERVKNKSRGPKVPKQKIQKSFIKKLNILKNDRVLDLGCGHGELFNLLSRYSQNVFGIDINKDAVKEASRYPYKIIKQGSAERTNLSKQYFDKIVVWGVYDVVEQEKALIEENKILKIGGSLLITGKNKNYLTNDREAFIAERNAKLKDFPNHFTDVYKLLNEASLFGYNIIEAWGFPKRGDFANNKYINLLKNKRSRFYEFLFILKKIGKPKLKQNKIWQEFSDVAISKARKNNFDNVKSFFKWHKDKYEK